MLENFEQRMAENNRFTTLLNYLRKKFKFSCKELIVDNSNFDELLANYPNIRKQIVDLNNKRPIPEIKEGQTVSAQSMYDRLYVSSITWRSMPLSSYYTLKNQLRFMAQKHSAKQDLSEKREIKLREQYLELVKSFESSYPDYLFLSQLGKVVFSVR